MEEKNIDMQKQMEADRRWISKNRERKRYLSQRSSARSFIRNAATKEDLEELGGMIQDRLKNF